MLVETVEKGRIVVMVYDLLARIARVVDQHVTISAQ